MTDASTVAGATKTLGGITAGLKVDLSSYFEFIEIKGRAKDMLGTGLETLEALGPFEVEA